MISFSPAGAQPYKHKQRILLATPFRQDLRCPAASTSMTDGTCLPAKTKFSDPEASEPPIAAYSAFSLLSFYSDSNNAKSALQTDIIKSADFKFHYIKVYYTFPSMSRRGNPYDNAMTENFSSILKTERIHRLKLN